MYSKTKKTAAVGMLCAFAYIATAVGRVPVVLFLKYDPKDVIIVITGFLFGPTASFSAALIVSFAEMLTISENGVLGLIMNVISSCSFACTAAFIYKRRRGPLRAFAGLFMRLGTDGCSNDVLELFSRSDLYGLSERGCGQIAASCVPAV